MFDPANPKSVSKTKQSFRNEVNINTIMAKAKKGAMVPITNKEAFFGDFTSAVDFATAQNRLIAAQEAFLRLPSAVRKRFENDPGKLLDFLTKEENEAEAVKLGLAKAKEPTAEAEAAKKAALEAQRKEALKADLKAIGVNVP